MSYDEAIKVILHPWYSYVCYNLQLVINKHHVSLCLIELSKLIYVTNYVFENCEVVDSSCCPLLHFVPLSLFT